MGFFDAFKKHSGNISNKERMRKIRQSGKDGEEQFRRDKMFSNIERRHHGKDFVEKKTDWTGKTHETPWEVKRNNSPLSPKQKRTRNLHVRRYVDTPYGVESRTEDKHGNKLEHNMLSGKYEKVKKSNTFSWFGSDSSTKKQKSTRSSYDSLFGSSSSGKKKSKRKSSGIW
ncbi:MAG: hypothetical protein ACW9XH_01835 [Candidatus Nitrosopumilus sp. bin_32a]